MKTPFRRMMACALLLGSFEAVSAQPLEDPAHHSDSEAETLVVAQPVTVDAWTSRVSTALDQHLSYPRAPGIADYPQGIVKVKFNCSETGAPRDVALIESSRSRVLDQALLRAVRNIPNLHPLPSGASAQTQFQAWMVFAHDDQTAARMKRSLQREMTMAKAAPKDAGDVHLAQLTIVSAAR